MRRKHLFLALAIVAALGFLAYAPLSAQADDSRPCPWSISKIQVGKWGNSNHKARIWVKGSFPIPPGVSERPIWFVNGTNVGHSDIFFGDRTLPNTSYLLKPGANTIEVKFIKPPYNGASYQKTIQGFDWSKVPNGGYKTFN